MPRPCKKRRVMGRPKETFFKPAGLKLRELKEVDLSYSELEAVKMIDYKEIPQDEAARKMDVSQPTFSRILKSARKKISEALIEGKAIKVKEDIEYEKA